MPWKIMSIGTRECAYRSWSPSPGISGLDVPYRQDKYPSYPAAISAITARIASRPMCRNQEMPCRLRRHILEAYEHRNRREESELNFGSRKRLQAHDRHMGTADREEHHQFLRRWTSGC